MRTTSKIIGFITFFNLAFFSYAVYGQGQGSSFFLQQNETKLKYNSDFHEASLQYVLLLEDELVTGTSFLESMMDFSAIKRQVTNNGMNENIAKVVLKFYNRVEMKKANLLHLKVVDLSKFYDYFYSNIELYITDNSPLYESMIDSGYSIHAIEKIIVKCNSDLCNNSDSTWLYTLVATEIILFSDVNVGDVAEATIVNDAGQVYQNTSPSFWRNNGMGSVELLPSKPCDTCELN